MRERNKLGGIGATAIRCTGPVFIPKPVVSQVALGGRLPAPIQEERMSKNWSKIRKRLAKLETMCAAATKREEVEILLDDCARELDDAPTLTPTPATDGCPSCDGTGYIGPDGDMLEEQRCEGCNGTGNRPKGE